MNQYFTRPDFYLMTHLESTTSVGKHLFATSIQFFLDSILPLLEAYIKDREVLIVHIDTIPSQNTATLVQQELTRQAVTCGAPTAVSASKLTDNPKMHDLVATYLGAQVHSGKLLILVVDQPTMQAFCAHDADSDTRYGAVTGMDVKIAGHP